MDTKLFLPRHMEIPCPFESEDIIGFVSSGSRLKTLPIRMYNAKLTWMSCNKERILSKQEICDKILFSM